MCLVLVSGHLRLEKSGPSVCIFGNGLKLVCHNVSKPLAQCLNNVINSSLVDRRIFDIMRGLDCNNTRCKRSRRHWRHPRCLDQWLVSRRLWRHILPLTR